ncbi:MAG: helix-turn-helix domain-containing protein [Nitrospirota bacterium]
MEKYGYSQKEIADYLKMHYSTISRILKDDSISKGKT